MRLFLNMRGHPFMTSTKKRTIFWPLIYHHNPQKWKIDLLLKNHKIQKHVIKFSSPPPPPPPLPCERHKGLGPNKIVLQKGKRTNILLEFYSKCQYSIPKGYTEKHITLTKGYHLICHLLFFKTNHFLQSY